MSTSTSAGHRPGLVARWLQSPPPESVLSRLPLYPFLLPILFVLSVYSSVSVSPVAVVRTLAIGGIVGLVVFAGSLAVLRDSHRAGVGSAVVLLAVVGWHSPTLVAAAMALLMICLYLATRLAGGPVPWRKVTWVVNGLVLLLLLTVPLKMVVTGSAWQLIDDLRALFVSQPAPVLSKDDPDIVVLLLDAYPRADTLQRLFDYDNEPFLSALAAQGFDVSRQSRSNYSATTLTMSSMLNMELLHDIPALKPVLSGGEAQPTLRNVTSHSEAIGFLRRRGYETVAFAPGYEESALRHADVFVDPGTINEFEMVILRATLFAPLTEVVAPNFMADQQRSRVERGLEFLVESLRIQSERPRFVWIHLPIPHGPILYGANGEPRWVSIQRPHDYNGGGQTREEERLQLRDQIHYINQRLLESLDAAGIVERRDLVLLMLSDHGSLIDLDQDSELDLRERVSNLFAARTPGGNALFPESHTLVNTFPILFNHYFGTDLAMREDRVFVSKQPFLFDWVELP